MTCRYGSTPCPGGNGRCVYELSVCDGEDDCGDNSDEDPEFCEGNGQLSLITHRLLFSA